MRTIARCLFGCLLFVLCLSFAGLATAQDDAKYAKRIYVTAHAGNNPPDMDGRLEDDCWEKVDWGGEFLEWDPDAGSPATFQTQFKILYDEDALYLGARAFDDDPDQIASILSRHDGFPGDWIEINIDSLFDKRTAFSFTSSVSGTRGDEFISDDGNDWDGSWDPVWQLATNIDDQGWTMEARIPLSQLRFGERDEHVWGIQVTRRIYREEERSTWQPKNRDDPGWVSRFGELHGIRGISAPRRIELLPYGVTKGENFEEIPGDPFQDGSSSGLTMGMDGKIGVTSDLTLDFTVNPDFGQVEADPSQVNLTAFETFFSERRPFFIEGNNIINFQIAPSIAGGGFTRDNLFYSRRIGRRPHGSPDLADGEYGESIDNTSIIGAAKLTGKTKSGFSVGLMESITAKERASISGPDGLRKQTVEPTTNFLVGRVQKDFDEGNTRIGVMGTAVNRSIDDPGLEFLHSAAYSGGLDFMTQWDDKAWYLAANGVFSHVRGKAEAIDRTQTRSARYFQRPDNDHTTYDPTRTSLSGHGGSARLGRVSGKFRFETGAAWRSPGFEINDAGFMRRADEINQFTWAGYRFNKPFSIFRQLSFNANQWMNWDFGGANIGREYNTNFNAQTKNNWRFGAGITRYVEATSNSALRGGPSSVWPGGVASWFWFNGDGRKTISWGFGGNLNDGDKDNAKRRNGWAYLSVRPSNAVRLFVEPSYSRNEREMQYITTESFGSEDRYLFGSIDQRTFNLTFRTDWTLSPNLTVQWYVSPFVSSGEYSDFKRITDPRAGEYRDRFHTFEGSEIAFNEGDDAFDIDEDGDSATDYQLFNPDFNFRDLNSNLVVRWQFQPGSTLFLVWQQARSGFTGNGTFSLGNDIDSLFDEHPHNVFLIKVNKWLSL